MASLTENSVNINGGTFGEENTDKTINIRGAYINLHNVRDGIKYDGNIASTVTGNNVTISGGTFNAATNVYGAYADLTYQPYENTPIVLYYHGTAAITDNTVTLTGNAGEGTNSLKNVNLYGYGYNETATNIRASQITDHNNNLIVDGWSGTVGSVNNFANINFENIKVAKENEDEAKSVFYIEATGDNNKNLASTTVNINSIDTSGYGKGTELKGTLTLDKDITEANINLNGISNFSYQDNEDNGLIAETLSGLDVVKSTDLQTSNHIITISATVGDTVLAGKLIDDNGTEHTNSNKVDTLTVGGEGFSTNNADIITGAYAAGNQTATGGKVNVEGSYTGKVYAGYSESGAATGNTMTLTSGADVKDADLYGGFSNKTVSDGETAPDVVTGNTLTIDGWSGTVNSLNNFSSIVYEHVSGEMELNANSVSGNNMSVVINSVAGGDYAANNGDTTTTLAAITLSDTVKNAIGSASLADELQKSTWIYGDYTPTSAAEKTGGIYANKLSGAQANLDKDNNKITVSAKVDKTVLAGKFIEEKLDSENKPIVHTNSNGETSLTIGEGFSTKADIVAGAYAAGDNEASGGEVYVESSDYTGTVYAGFSENGTVGKNTAYIGNGAQAANLTLAGDNQTAGTPSSAALAVSGNSNTLKSISRFDTITFDDIKLNDAAALTVTSADLTGTTLEVASLAGGTQYHAGVKVTLLTALTADAITGNVKSLGINNEIIQACVAQNLTVSAVQEGNSINLTVTGVGLTPQTNLVAETHAATAAFVNQGTDLINDSLDVLGRDGSYGVKTFAAVQGNRSTYDVADDLKINGWSVIAGFGAENEHKGGDFAWGVFYENGSGNYRTYNTFNNEFFRGDGSMVYNGGGIAARYENAKGVYTEGSLRAGTLKNEMDNALRDASGASYGYETESTYYGAHIGVGQIFELSENTDLDIYGKFFHTYVEGDSFTIGGDVFDFDSITSDRLRVGARVTKQQAKVNTYYGLAYEYEFNGDADMKAAGIKADRQSFGGGTGIAELGFNYQPGNDSPWNFDLNLRGYVGERQGGSFNVQATYSF